MKKKVVIAVVAGACVVVGVMGFKKLQKKQVDLNDFITIEYQGYDSAGTAYADVDEEKLELAILEAKGVDIEKYNEEDIDWKDITSYFSSGVYELMDSVSVETAKSDNLKNGDTVEVSIQYDEDLAKENGIRFTAKEEEYTVSGLEELIEVDPFADLTVRYSGFAPNASISYENNSDNSYVRSLYFTAENDGNLDIGDTVTLEVSADQDMAMANGYRLTQTTKEYTVDSADRYITSYDGISKEMLKELQSEATDIIESYFAGLTEYVTAGDYTYEGAYMLQAKEDSYWSDINRIELIYSTTVTSVNNEFEPTKVYLPVSSCNLIEYANGQLEYYMGSDVQGVSGLTYNTGWWDDDLAGYTDGKKMYNDLISAHKAEYTYEVTDELTQFGK